MNLTEESVVAIVRAYIAENMSAVNDALDPDEMYDMLAQASVEYSAEDVDYAGAVHEFVDGSVPIWRNDELVELWSAMEADGQAVESFGGEFLAETIKERGLYGVMAVDVYVALDNELRQAWQEIESNVQELIDSLDYGDTEPVSICPACGVVIDYCQGHGEIGDPEGFAIISAHDDGSHQSCHPNAECRQVDGDA